MCVWLGAGRGGGGGWIYPFLSLCPPACLGFGLPTPFLSLPPSLSPSSLPPHPPLSLPLPSSHLAHGRGAEGVVVPHVHDLPGDGHQAAKEVKDGQGLHEPADGASLQLLVVHVQHHGVARHTWERGTGKNAGVLHFVFVFVSLSVFFEEKRYRTLYFYYHYHYYHYHHQHHHYHHQ